MKRALFALCVVLSATPVTAQTNTCTAAPPTATVINPTQVCADLPEQTSNLTNRYDFAYFNVGDNPNATGVTPAQGPSTIPKTAWTLLTGICYCAAMPAPIPAPGGPFTAAFRAVRTSFDPATSLWGAVSNPFDDLPAAAPATPGRAAVR